MATSTNLLGMEIHEVQENWSGHKDLWATNCVAKTSPKDIYFFMVVTLTESLKIMDLKGIHSPEALWWWGGLIFCPWCGMEGQNEGTIVNHLWTMCYQLSIVCAWCLEYFTTNADAMCRHTQLCKPSATGDNDNNRDFEEDDNDDEDDEFIYNED